MRFKSHSLAAALALTGSAAAWLAPASALAAPTTDEKLQILSDELDRLRADLGKQGGASGATTLGGYGEMHYNNLDSGKQIDFHRFVLFVGHRFSDSVRLFSELELEHSNTENGGAVELEQAYIEMDLNRQHRLKTGLFLIPVGILNETHEPPTFYGVERNPVENKIIPTTWWEGGLGLSGELGAGLKYDLAMTSGLQIATTGGTDPAYVIRDGRQNVSEAPAENWAYTARLRWTAVPGVELGVAANYQSDITQGLGAVGSNTPALLTEAHVVANKGNFGLRALYAQWDLDSADAAGTGRDRQYGWYVEPSYKITPKIGVFARYAAWDNTAGDNADSRETQTNAGLSYWPVEQVVFKFDVQRQGGTASDDGYNLAVGYMF